MATVLVIGSGGREAAQALKLAESPRVAKVLMAPGNGGTIGGKLQNLGDVKDSDIAGLVACAKEHKVSLVAVGPEGPLVAGVADALAAAGIPCFGPTQAAARLEASKAYSKELFDRHNLPTARYRTFTDFDAAAAHAREVDYPVVVKASGLAAGKGVLMPEGREATVEALRAVMVDKVFGAAGETVVVEELLVGPECSVLAFCDGSTSVCMPAAQDHKRALDGDLGLNTGGMGAYAPAPCMTAALEVEVRSIVQRTVDALASEGCPYVGVLFAGLMLTKDGPKLLEYNCRMGDPETEVLMPLLASDLYEVMLACTQGTLADVTVEWRDASAATVVLAARGYPETYPKGLVIGGVDAAAALKGVTVYHAGTRREDAGRLVSSGGRVLAVTGVAPTLRAAVDRAYAAAAAIDFGADGNVHYRRDIAHQAL